MVNKSVSLFGTSLGKNELVAAYSLPNRFQTMRTMFFRGALGALIVFDLTREQTFTDLKKWLKDLKTSSPGALSILVGNKNDLEDMRVISREEAEKFAEENNCISYIETSAKSGINVADAFNTIGERLLNRKLDELGT